MIRFITGKLQRKIRFDRSADIRRRINIDAPPPIFVLMLENPVAALLEAHRIAGAKQRVQQNIVALESSVSDQFAAPVAFLVLLGE